LVRTLSTSTQPKANYIPASRVYAQNATHCTGSVYYVINVPASTASSGAEDIFFQISGPSTMSWIGLGQGDDMSGANVP
jgi:hypothetical protein